MPYNPNIMHVHGEVSVEGGTGSSDVNVMNKPTVNVENTITPIDTNVTNDPLNVAIANTPSVNIANTPSVNATISGTPSVAVSNVPNVTISGTPSVSASISNTPSVTVSGTPSVNISTMPTVTIGNASLNVNATMVGTPAVTATLNGTSNVAVTNTPSVNAAITNTPTVNIGTVPNVTIANNPLNVSVSNTPSVNATVIGTPSVNATLVGTSNVAITNTPTVNIGTMPTVIATTSMAAINNDAGGRTRTSDITTLLDGKLLNADNTLLFENVGTGTGTFTNNLYSMSVTAGQYFIKRAKRFSPYFSGKSQLVEQTFDNFQPQTNVVKRAGYFSSNAVAPYDSDKDGFWLESDSSTVRLITSRFGIETLNLPITSWSGYANLGVYQNLTNWQNFTVGIFDFLWLGGAVLRLFLKTQNGFTLAHQFDYAGTSQGQFILSPNKPIRYEIRSTGGSGSLRYICSQVASEGSINESGQTLALFNSTAISCNTVGTIYALKSVRKVAGFRDNAVQIISMDATNAATSDSGVLMLVLNPTLSSPISYTAKSVIEEGTPTNQTLVAGTGRVVAAAPVTRSGGGTDTMKTNFLSFLGSTINNTMDEMVLAYMPTTTNQSVTGIMVIKEYK